MPKRLRRFALLMFMFMTCRFFYRIANVQPSAHSQWPLPSAPPPPISPAEVLRDGNGIIFIETTDRMKPPSLVLCTIESAARVYRHRPVVFFMEGLRDITAMRDALKRLPTLSSFHNVHLFPLQMERLFHGTPLRRWYEKVNPERERYWTHVSSDGCRLALIWRHGGIYMDSDFISMRPIPTGNFLAAESSDFSSNGIFGLTPRHSFAWKGMESFVRNYRGAKWGHQGPQLFTRVLKQYCIAPRFQSTEDVKCGDISILKVKRFYPIPYESWSRYYEVWQNVPKFRDSYALHLWNYLNRGQKTMVPGSNTLVEHLYQLYCPTLYGALRRNESIYG
ncbi:hypothetical protein XENTR_v10017371 [Xenopus tropicalis]|uniref:Alpha-1,4-N-acetylglucosaminyltransferase n=1 Tax=Xenopus tropicalis TaxID=8364 RepID=B7ZTR8_XENTR|nr:alpha-1,4-N-acetylglucosaminyltransferase isoform X1 [Xenopus tropicalis]AAI70971.1 hypothetical protein LOC549416 [Xenopus tropicalis]KAE8599866.1 hypothetical protein XENTR_v10017371 [Xenopus tropicalis]